MGRCSCGLSQTSKCDKSCKKKQVVRDKKGKKLNPYKILAELIQKEDN